MVDFFDPGGSPGTSFVQTAMQRDPRAIMAALLMRQGVESVNAPTPSPAGALAKALTIGLGGLAQGQLTKEYQGRDESARKTLADALARIDKPDATLYDPGIPGADGAPDIMAPKTTTEPGGLSGALQVLAKNPDTASLGMSQALALGLAGAKARLEQTNKDAEAGLRTNPVTGVLEQRPGFGPARGAVAADTLRPQIPVQVEQKRAEFFGTPQTLAPATSIVDLSNAPGAPPQAGTTALPPGAAAPAGALVGPRTLAQNTMSPMNVALNTQKTFADEAATKAAGIVEASSEQAKAAVTTVNTTGRIRQALDQANLGPTATLRQGIDQIAYGLGMGDQNTEQRLASTRQVIQGLADLTLTSRASLKGQGQITEGEQALLAKARSGNIDSMTLPEIKTVLDVSDRIARTQYDNHKTNLDAFKKAPGSEMLVPFYTPPPLPERAAPAESKSDHPAGASAALPAGVPTGSTPAGTERGTGKPVYKTPAGKLVVID